jgi:2-oxoglutarate dehydrogenase E2 component (dihydrolipoamide succinyltransferase)
MSAMRKAIAEHMVMSKRTSAHVTTIHKVDMTRVEKMRQKHKADFQARYGLSLTYLPFITRATVEGLRTYPLLNASIDGANIATQRDQYRIGGGAGKRLIVPVFAAPTRRTCWASAPIWRLARAPASSSPTKCRAARFRSPARRLEASSPPVINQPQVAIPARAWWRSTVVIDDAIAIR